MRFEAPPAWLLFATAAALTAIFVGGGYALGSYQAGKAAAAQPALCPEPKPVQCPELSCEARCNALDAIAVSGEGEPCECNKIGGPSPKCVDVQGGWCLP